MDDIDDVVRRLRHRAASSRGQGGSLESKAADALDQLRQELGRPPARPAVSERPQTRAATPAQPQPSDVPSAGEDLPAAPAATGSPPSGPDMSQRALTLKEAAALLHVSYWTVYEHRESLGFFKVGGAWRVWPDKLREATAPTSTPQPTPREQESKPCRSENAKTGSITSISARQAEIELDKLLAQPTRRKRRNSTTK